MRRVRTPSAPCFDPSRNNSVLAACAAAVLRQEMAVHVLQLAAAVAAVAGFLDVQNYSVLLRHGSKASCPCFRIPCMVTTQDTAQASTLVLLVEARSRGLIAS